MNDDGRNRPSPGRRSTPSRRGTVLDALTLGMPLTAVVSVMSPIAPVGGRLTFAATGFSPNGFLRVFLDYDRTAPLACFFLDDHGAGGDVTRVPIPWVTPEGSHILTFDDGVVDFDLRFVATATTAMATVVPSSLAPGGRLLFTGSGFPPHHLVNVKLDNTGDPVPHQADGLGDVAGEYQLPRSVAAGAHELRFLTTQPAVSTSADFEVRP